jgi:YD repeat-containing protein
MAYRSPGAPILVPAVMHWKVGHFAALLEGRDGLYHVGDATFGEDIWISQATLENEASGYFVVPEGALPQGWRPVSAAEGNRIWGRGVTTGNDGQGTGRCDPTGFGAGGDGGCSGGGCGGGGGGGMSTANIQAMVVGLTLHDVALHYPAPKGPQVTFELDYSHRDAEQPAIFTYTNFGPKWTSNWISYITDNTSTNGTLDIYTSGGGAETYSFIGDVSIPGLVDQAVVTRMVSGGKTIGFTRQLPDGSMQTYMEPFGTNQFFLTSISDPQGNTVSLTYDKRTRITTITDAIGEKTTLIYGLASDLFKVTKVVDPFGRSASFTYNSNGELASITDMLGITSSFLYLFGSGDFIDSMTTPYGTTRFTYGDATTDFYLGTTRFVTITDPLGQTERVEYHDNAPGIASIDPANTVPTGMTVMNHFLSFRNTFVWDKHQLPLATNSDGTLDFTKATIMHWLHSDNINVTSRVLESIKQPLETRVWFNYAGQSQPIQVGSSNLPTAAGRVLDDGTTQLATVQRKSTGHPTQFTDPAGRQMAMTYAANGIDLAAVANITSGTNQSLWSATYNNQHEPLTVTDTSGQLSEYTYNAAGQLLTMTDPLNETVSYTYSPSGLLTSTREPFTNAVTRYTYDSFNRVSSTTDSQGYRLLFGYDSADRLTSIEYPDATSTRYFYKLLDLASTTDRLKRTNNYTHDALRRLTQVARPQLIG